MLILPHLATENQTEYSVRSNNDDKSYEDNFASIENQLKTLESKFLDKTLSIANDLNNLKKYCLNNEVEGMNILRQENASLKVENEALKDSLYTAKFALSDLNTKVKDLEHEKASLKSHCQPQCTARPNLLGGHFNGGIIDVSVFNP